MDEDRLIEAQSAHERLVEKHRIGCNKHFKDNFLNLGYQVKECMKFPPGADPKKDKGALGFCAWPGGKPPDDIDVYSVEKEAAYFACQYTVGKHTEQIAKYISKKFEKNATKELDDVVRDACLKKANCLDRKY